MIALSYNEWLVLQKRIANDHPPSVILVRTKCRDVLGFMPRRHKEWKSIKGKWVHVETVYLDFYDDDKETWFRLKYMHYE